MRLLVILLSVISCFGLPHEGVAQTASNQIIDTDQSIVNFKIGNMRIRKVKGTFDGMSGTLSFDPQNLAASQFNVCIDAATVNTKSKKRDDHLRNEDFFEVETYPNICFVSKEVSSGETGYSMSGELTMHGVTREVEFPFTFDGSTFTGTLLLKRLDYKVGEGTGKGMVGDEVEITITCMLEG